MRARRGGKTAVAEREGRECRLTRRNENCFVRRACEAARSQRCDRIGKNGSGSAPTRSGNPRATVMGGTKTTGIAPSGKSPPRKPGRAKPPAARPGLAKRRPRNLPPPPSRAVVAAAPRRALKNRHRPRSRPRGAASRPKRAKPGSSVAGRCQRSRSAVEPSVLEPPAIVVAVDHHRVPLEIRLPARSGDGVEDCRPRAILGKLLFD